MITLGPYSFTTTDALRTFGNLGGLWESMMEGRSSASAAALGEALRTRLAGALDVGPNVSLVELGTTASKTLGDSPDLAALLDDVWTTLGEATSALRADGQLPVTALGRVTQLSASGGGVPKLPIASADIDYRGVVGDVQRTRVHHGRPWQALCLYADEVIDQLRAEGHPINRGSVGENITVAGLDWSQIRPGVRLRIGGVLALVQAYAEPCATNAAFFVGGDFQRMNRDRGPVSRVYATVLEPGRIVTGDEVILEPVLADAL